MVEFMTFEQWKAAVDEACVLKCGMSTDCLPDVNYRGLYDMKDTLEEAADYVIENAKEV